jgi:serine/threonine protein kinase
MRPSSHFERAPEQFGRYLVFERVGMGGMATVHRALARGAAGFEREVALKRMLPSLADNEEFVRRFVHEAQIASQLRHGNIVQLYELGRVDDTFYIVMEYIDGYDLQKCLLRARGVASPPPFPVVLSIIYELLDALEYAHNLCDEQGRPIGLVHRDISPSNLIVARFGNLKIIDFGIAKAVSSLSRSGSGLKGKMAYMAPEGVHGQVDARADLFSAGVIAHELICAQPLFGGGSDFRTLRNVQSKEPPPPSLLNSDSPHDLDEVVLRALAKDPAERWQSAREMREALSKVASRYRVYADARVVEAWLTHAFGRPGRRKHTTIERCTCPACIGRTEPRDQKWAIGSQASLLPGPERKGSQVGPPSPLNPDAGLIDTMPGAQPLPLPPPLPTQAAPRVQSGSSARTPRQRLALILTILICALATGVVIGLLAT